LPIVIIYNAHIVQVAGLLFLRIPVAEQLVGLLVKFNGFRIIAEVKANLSHLLQAGACRKPVFFLNRTVIHFFQQCKGGIRKTFAELFRKIELGRLGFLAVQAL